MGVRETRRKPRVVQVVKAHNKYRQFAPAGPDAQTAAHFVRRCGRRYGARVG